MAADALQEKYEKKEQLWLQIQELGNRQSEWGAEERQQWDDLNEQIDTVQESIETEEQQDEVLSRMEALAEQNDRRKHARQTEVGQFRANRDRSYITDEMRAYAFAGMVFRITGDEEQISSRHMEAMHAMGLSRAQKFHINLGTGMTHGFGCWSRNRGNGRIWDRFYDEYGLQFRGPLDTGTATGGAEWVPAESFRAELIKFMIAFGGLRGVCRIITTNSGEPMRMPTVDDTSNEAEDVAELGSVTAVDPTTGDVTWNAYKQGSKVKWSYEMQQDSPLAIMTILAQLLGERIGRKQGPYFASGTGTGQPQGITVGATDSGATWSLAGADPTKADALIDCQTALDPAYESVGSIGWVFKKSTLGSIRKLKDAESRYIWQPGLRAGEPDLLLGDPYALDQSFPAESGTNRFIVYGNLSDYIIRDVGSMRTQVLRELHADTDELGMNVWMRSDGRVARSASILYIAASA